MPSVELGTEKEFWIAVCAKDGKVETFLTVYQNRPHYEGLEDGDYPSWVLHSSDGEPVHSVGWKNQHDHPEYSGWYEPIEFDNRYRLLGWAEYEAPVFNGVAA